jgi:membrane-associated phospholipid phosphatase
VRGNRRIWSWVIALGIAALALTSAFWLDPAVHIWVTEHQNPDLKIFLQKVSRFGDWPEHAVLGFLLAGIAWLRGSRKWTRIFLSMLIACALAGAAARVIKVATGRARPSVKAEQAWTGPRWSEKFHAFPSGHTAASSAFFAVLFFANWRMAIACLPIPLLIGFSRMYVAAHYLSDVLFATILGALCAAIVWRFFCKQSAVDRAQAAD